VFLSNIYPPLGKGFKESPPITVLEPSFLYKRPISFGAFRGVLSPLSFWGTNFPQKGPHKEFPRGGFSSTQTSPPGGVTPAGRADTTHVWRYKPIAAVGERGTSTSGALARNKVKDHKRGLGTTYNGVPPRKRKRHPSPVSANKEEKSGD